MTTALVLKGVLNFKKFQELSEERRKAFFIKHANEVLPILVQPNWYDDPDVEYVHEYEINAQYVLLDSFYSECGNVSVSLTWSRCKGAELNKIDYDNKNISKKKSH